LVDNIDMQKVLSPVSPPRKVKEAKERQSNKKQRNFGRELHEEKERINKNKQKQPEKRLKKTEIDGSAKPKLDENEEDDSAAQGKLIDVVV